MGCSDPLVVGAPCQCSTTVVHHRSAISARLIVGYLYTTSHVKPARSNSHKAHIDTLDCCEEPFSEAGSVFAVDLTTL